MENQNTDNLNLLEAVVQNTEMGKNTLEQIVPMTEDAAFRAELLRQRNLYRELNQEAHTAIEACGGTAQGQSAMAKFNTKMGISMKTLTDKSTRNLAEMLSEGSSQGSHGLHQEPEGLPRCRPGRKAADAETAGSRRGQPAEAGTVPVKSRKREKAGRPPGFF